MSTTDRAHGEIDFSRWAGDSDYQFYRLALGVSEIAARRMHELGVSRQDLAQEMKVSAPRVTQILRGDANLTLRVIAKLSVALGVEFDIALQEDVAPRDDDLDDFEQRLTEYEFTPMGFDFAASEDPAGVAAAA